MEAWSPFQLGFFEGVFIGNYDKFPELNQTLEQLGEKYETTPSAIAATWILRHPANIQLIAGTTNRMRMADIIKGSEIQLSREEWYRLYLNRGHILP
ncbi:MULTISPECIES: aldo/keto reductase [Bacillaceae]|uniref:aldo/keto reductase n=1 Tax=Bacillaceae TaxID=186817 RepID=UPI001CEFAB88